jgi:hypothetical protein
MLAVCAAPARAVQAFPTELVFQPLLADPRWPAFSGTLQSYRVPKSRVFWAANFGESFPFVGNRGGERWQFGLQAAVFTLWDLTTQSDDLVNADFIVGFPYTWRNGRWSYMARIFHQSSHLGDEFILTHNNIARVNVSYEALDGKISYDFDHGFRGYAGAGSMIRKYPPELKPLFGQIGAEWLGPLFARQVLRPVAGVDFQKQQQNGWYATGVSLRAGVQMQHREQNSRRVQFLVDYYQGHDPNGQFFAETIELIGLGAHIYF